MDEILSISGVFSQQADRQLDEHVDEQIDE
jgi:hypothetical protein